VKRLAFVAFFLGLSGSTAAQATTVFVTSIAAGRVEIVVNGSTMRKLRAGETSPEGVRAIEVGRDSALLEIDGRRWQMQLGASTTSSTVVQADDRGHFIVAAHINGVPVRVIVDTGATSIALNMNDAARMGINFAAAQRGIVRTAGGPRGVLNVRLATVQVGDILLRDVEASVSEANELPITLLGMSFLNQVEMQRTGRTLTLTRRH
jgi:aspartyl protease family protein